MLNPAEAIISRFGGISAMARAMGHEYPSTVSGWKMRGIIPARRQKEVLAAASRLGIDVVAEDFFSPRKIKKAAS